MEQRKAVLSFDLAKRLFDGNDENLKQLALDTYPELSPPTTEELFLDLLNGCVVTTVSDNRYTMFIKNGDWLFEYDKQVGAFRYSVDRVKVPIQKKIPTLCSYRLNYQIDILSRKHLGVAPLVVAGALDVR